MNFSKFKFEYLRENEFLRKTILACLSGDQMGSINEKNRGKKSRDTAPLRYISFYAKYLLFMLKICLPLLGDEIYLITQNMCSCCRKASCVNEAEFVIILY